MCSSSAHWPAFTPPLTLDSYSRGTKPATNSILMRNLRGEDAALRGCNLNSRRTKARRCVFNAHSCRRLIGCPADWGIRYNEFAWLSGTLNNILHTVSART
jgi:hypothetical protein